VELLDVKVVSEDELMKQIYLKLIVNSVLNSLTGLFQVKNGVITEIQPLYPIIQDLVMECWPLFHQSLDVTPIELMDLIISVASKTAQNNNSMQVDIASGKDSEIDYILGYLLKTANRQRLALPKFQILYHLVNSKAEIIKKFKRLDQ
jgi:2-dehydropantoate 2-reductase